MAFEILEHTADIGLRVRASSLAELFGSAALGLESLALDVSNAEPKFKYRVETSGEDVESLLVNWLNEIIYLLDGERLAFCKFDIKEVTQTAIHGVAWGEPRDRKRHAARLVVKAATYHQLSVRSGPEGWTAEVFFDI